ncbi:VOC family protein [Brevibacillus sp. HB2.2]|uniref:VOC family protein n=1 Tax=Brevibacillus sp. HB2.2 TaxID=2738846 RepID=UPI00156BD2DF|nr:VOC family protein [Brevibacillus sp. HB2.2]NRS51995.1 VOC family protein [Brevibacillus sp. HB2.2]
MSQSSISVQPMIPSDNVDESVAFYSALGFEIVRDETFPYRFAEVRDGDLRLMTSSYAQFGGRKAFGALIVSVTELGKFHDRFANNLKNALGTVPLSGLPRLTRRSRDGSQFRLFDPFGNMIVYMDKHYTPPLYLESQDHTDEILNQVWFLRDIYANDRAAANMLDRSLEETKNETGIGRARLLAARAELAVARGELELATRLEDMLAHIHLQDSEIRKFQEELGASQYLRNWAGIESGE